MSDPVLIREVLSQILMGARRIERRAASVHVPNDFLDSDAGLDKLDAICMMLIAIGESVKNLDKITDGTLLPRFPQVDWKGVKGVRDVISHQYFDVDAEAVHSICKKHIPVLIAIVEKMIAEQK
ncbi:MAG: DUF86 domain-containing protein [Gammaproteobacteria bacterium]|nr:DUF86 domain-containing protein [Gammaproteobacteria bacterium]